MSAITIAWLHRWLLDALTAETVALAWFAQSWALMERAEVMWNSAWNELREVVYLAAMVGGLSVVGVGLAVALVLAGVA